MESLRRRIKLAREAAGLTIEGAAEAADVPATWWSYLEWNRRTPPPVPMLRRVLNAVELDADKVLREEGLL